MINIMRGNPRHRGRMTHNQPIRTYIEAHDFGDSALELAFIKVPRKLLQATDGS